MSISNQQTLRHINVLSFLMLITDLILLTILVKHSSFPYSKTWSAYLQWVGNYISLFIGYIALPLSIIINIPIALKTGHVDKPEAISIYNRILKKLDSSVLAYSILGIVSTLLLVLLVCPLVWNLRIPAPPNPGKMVISNFYGSNKYFRVIENDCLPNGVGIYNITDSKYPQAIYFSKSESQIENIAVSYDEKYIYATDSKNGTVVIIANDPYRGLQIIDKKYVGKTAASVVLSADGKKLYVAVTGGGGTLIPGKICVFDISGSALKELTPIENIGYPVSLFIAQKNSLLCVASQGGFNNDPLYVIDTRTDKPQKMISGFGVVSKVIATRDGQTVFIFASNSLYIVRNYMNNTPDIKIITRDSIPIRIDKEFIPDSYNFRDSSASFSTMTLTPDERTLIVGASVNGKILYENKTFDYPFGEIVSIDVESGKFCVKKPFNTESAPEVITIADNGKLYAPIKLMRKKWDDPCERIAEGDSRVMKMQ